MLMWTAVCGVKRKKQCDARMLKCAHIEMWCKLFDKKSMLSYRLPKPAKPAKLRKPNSRNRTQETKLRKRSSGNEAQETNLRRPNQETKLRKPNSGKLKEKKYLVRVTLG